MRIAIVLSWIVASIAGAQAPAPEPAKPIRRSKNIPDLRPLLIP